MLGRAWLPLSRPRTLAPALRIAFAAPQRRLYAKEKKPKPKSDQKLPALPPRSQPRTAASHDSSRDNVHSQSNPSPSEAPTAPEFESVKQPLEDIPLSAGEPFYENDGQRKDQTSSITPAADAFEEELSNGKRPRKQPLPEEPFYEDDGQGKDQTSNITPAADTFKEEMSNGNRRKQPLPDLTKGIPSTLDTELKQARSREEQPSASLNVTEDPAEPLPSSGGGGRGGDGLPKNAYISSNERKKNALIKYTYLAVAGAVFGWTLYLGRNWESEEEERRHPDARSGWGLGLFYGRAKARMGSTLSYYNEPAFPKLLPDEDADPNQRAPFTLVLSLEDLLVHQEWTRESGWRIAKRPGLDYFIRYLSQYYELVLFTSQPSFIGDTILRKLDPYRIIRWPLFREATLYKKGEYIKDLSYLNRDMSKIIMIDTVPSHAKHQPENAIILPKWNGDPRDQTLVQLIPFLEYVATMGFEDTRKVLQSFEGKYIPAEFAKREKLLREKFEARLAEQRKTKPKLSVGGISSFFGVKSQPVPNGIDVNALTEGEMLWDQIRKRGQKQYELFNKQIQEEGQKWLDDMAAEEKALQQQSISSMKGSFFGFFGFGRSDGGEKK